MSRQGVVTIVFTDLVGSTAIATRLGEEATDALRRVHFELLERAAALTHGRVVKNLGDGVMVAYRSVAEGVAGSEAMQQAIDRHNRQHAFAERLAIRVGVAAGEAVIEGDDFFGTPVVEAERLCAKAEGGQILVTDLVRTLARGRGGHSFATVGALDLEGLPEPVATAEAVWSPLPSTSPVPVAADLAASADLPVVGRFVGRSAELAFTSAMAKEARNGQRRSVFVAGEPGIGKTRLVGHLALEQHAEGATVLFGRCDEQVRSPFRPFLEALNHLIEHSPDYDVQQWARSLGADLARLMPELRERFPELEAPRSADADTERLRLFQAVDTFVGRASSEWPILVLIDDLHWADEASLLLLRHLMCSTIPAALLIVGVYRESELATGHPLVGLLADLRRTRVGERLVLDGFDEESTAELIAARLGRDPEPSLIRAIRSETDGNPFFIEEMLAHLGDTGALDEIRGGGGATRAHLALPDSALPDSVREVIGHRLARLQPTTQRVLKTAAVVGREFDVDVVVGAGELSEVEVLSAAEEAVHARLVVEVPHQIDRYAFAHALTRETLYSELTNSRRVRLHRRVASTLEDRYAADSQRVLGHLAYHFFAGRDDGDVDKAIEYAAKAGTRALELLAYEEAAGHYSLALRALDSRNAGQAADYVHRVELSLALGDARYRAGQIEDSRQAFREVAALAAERGDGELLARAAIGFNAFPLLLVRGEIDEESIRLIQQALGLLAPGDSITRATLLYYLARAFYFAGAGEVEAPALEARAMAERLGGREGRVLAVEAELLSLWRTEHAARRLALANELLELAEDAGDTQRVWWARLNRAIQSAALGDLEGVETEEAEFTRLAEERRRPEWLWYPALWRAMRALVDGRLEDAEILTSEALAIGQEPYGLSAFSVYVQQLFRLRDLQGRVGELEIPMRVLIESNDAAWSSISADPSDDSQPLSRGPLLHVAMAAIYASTDRMSEASAEFDLLAVDDFAGVQENAQWPLVAAFSANMIPLLERTDLAPFVYRRLIPYSGQCLCGGVASEVTGSIDTYLGMLATAMKQWADAEAHFKQALEMNRRIGNRPAVVEVLLRWSELLLLHRNEEGDFAPAVEMLREARAISDQLGLARFPQIARDFLSGLEE